MTTDIQFVPCHMFGGGWLVPRTDRGLNVCRALMCEEPTHLLPIGEDGYIIEPSDIGDAVTALRDRGCTVTL